MRWASRYQASMPSMASANARRPWASSCRASHAPATNAANPRTCGDFGGDFSTVTGPTADRVSTPRMRVPPRADGQSVTRTSIGAAPRPDARRMPSGIDPSALSAMADARCLTASPNAGPWSSCMRCTVHAMRPSVRSRRSDATPRPDPSPRGTNRTAARPGAGSATSSRAYSLLKITKWLSDGRYVRAGCYLRNYSAASAAASVRRALKQGDP